MLFTEYSEYSIGYCYRVKSSQFQLDFWIIAYLTVHWLCLLIRTCIFAGLRMVLTRFISKMRQTTVYVFSRKLSGFSARQELETAWIFTRGIHSSLSTATRGRVVAYREQNPQHWDRNGLIFISSIISIWTWQKWSTTSSCFDAKIFLAFSQETLNFQTAIDMHRLLHTDWHENVNISTIQQQQVQEIKTNKYPTKNSSRKTSGKRHLMNGRVSSRR